MTFSTMRFATALLVGLLPLGAAAQITIVGSDLLKPALEPVLEQFAVKSGSAIDLSLKGSLPGSEEWNNGKADLLIRAVLPDAPAPADAFPIAYTPIIVQVHKQNPIAELSIPQLATIFADGGNNQIRWNEVGGTGLVASRTINPAIIEEQGSILIDLFRDRVLQGKQLKPTVKRVNADTEGVLLLSGDQSVILISDQLPAVDGPSRALPISRGGKENFAFEPTEQNIYYGEEYSLRIAYYVCYKRKDLEKVKPVLRVLLSDETAIALKREGFTTVPENIRKRLLTELDK